MRRYKEPLKTMLIVLLSASALFLMWKSNIFSGLLTESGDAAPTEEPADSVSLHAAALPVAAAVTGPGGLCHGVKYDAAALSALYLDFSADLSEALGSGSEPAAISQKSWQKRLGQEGLYLDFGFALPVETLADWLGVTADWAKGRSARSLLLTDAGDGTVQLSFYDGSSYAGCRSAASWKSLHDRMESYLPNGAEFAFQSAGLENAAADTLISEALPALYAASASTQQQTAAAVLAEWIGMNLSGASSYEESDGTRVYPGDNGILRLGSNGEVTLTVPTGVYLAPAERASVFIEQVRQLLEAVYAAGGGEESVRLTAYKETAGGAEIGFSCCLEGLPITLSEGYAAWAVWDGSGVTELRLLPRSYHLAEVVEGLLPEKQAAAAAGSREPGAEALLTLFDIGEERVEPLWAIR